MTASSYLRNRMAAEVGRHIEYKSPYRVYVSLHTDDPGLTGKHAIGFTVRKRLAFGPVTEGATQTTETVAWKKFDQAASVTHIGVWDHPTDGNFLMAAKLTDAVSVAKGQGFRISAGALRLLFT